MMYFYVHFLSAKKKKMHGNTTHVCTYFSLSLFLTKAFPELSALSLLSLTFTDTSGSWVTETLFLHWGFTGHHNSCSASCCSPEGETGGDFSPSFSVRKEWHSTTLTLGKRFSSPLSGEQGNACASPHRPPHHHPHKCLNELAEMSGYTVPTLLQLFWNEVTPHIPTPLFFFFFA